MADVPKTVKVVSKGNGSAVSVCELTSNNIEADSLEIQNSPSDNDPTDLTLNLPSPDEGTSLQELIESELALRKELMESQYTPEISHFTDPVEECDDDPTIEVIQCVPVKTSPPVFSPQEYDEGDYDPVDINTQFILAERNHSFQSFTGNDTFFFNTLDDTQMNGADPYMKEEQDAGERYILDGYGIENPQEQNGIDVDPSVPDVEENLHESSESDCNTDSSVIKDGIDQITLSTFDPFTTIVDSSKSEPIDNPDVIETPSSECADSDFILMQSDAANGGDILNGTGGKYDPPVDATQNYEVCDGDFVEGYPEEEGNGDLPIDDIVDTNEVLSVKVINSMDEVVSCSNDLVQTVGHVVTNVFDTVEIDDDDIPLTPEEYLPKESVTPTGIHVNIPSIDIIPPDDNDISESELVSNEELSLASNSHDPDSDIGTAIPDEGFDTWTTVEEAVEPVEEQQHYIAKPSDVLEDVTEEAADEDDLNTMSPVHDDTAPEPEPEPADLVPEPAAVASDPADLDTAKITDSSCSDSESSEALTAEKTEKKSKKKKTTDPTKTKKTKKTKKSDEKENISVNVNGEDSELTHVVEVASGDKISPKDTSPSNTPAVDDDLSSVSVKELKSTYANQIGSKSSKEKEIDEGILHCGSVQSLRRSFGDLSTLCDKDDGNGGEQESAAIGNDMKSSFSKFDQLSKKTVLHVRSVDASKVQKQFNQTSEATPEQTSNCKSCGKQVFQMEQVKAERAVWHKNCFRCKECNKQLTVDIYSSHEGELYCKPHFRELFKPKAVVDEEPEMPSDKPDLGLDELTTLNVKSRYQVFEKQEGAEGAEVERSPSTVSVKRSPSILSKLARWEQGQSAWREEQRIERKQEISNIRSKLFMEGEEEEDETDNPADRLAELFPPEIQGKQGKMKEMYEQAVQDSQNATPKKEVGIRSEKAKSIKERFERGEVLPDDEEEDREDGKKGMDEDMSVFEAGISKKSRSLFLELDASAAKSQQQYQQQQQLMSPLKSPQIKDDIRRKSKEANSPEREIYRDPEVVRSEDKMADEEVMKTNTAKKMLSIFRQMEENATKEDVPDGPKPLKRFTPPPEYTRESETSEEETESDEEEEEEEEEDGDPNIVRASDKIEDEFLKQAQNAARAKALRAKFERWEEKENKANANAATNASHAVGNLNGGLELDQSSEHTSIDTTKSLRARFESLKNEAQQPKERTPRPKVNRFVELQTTSAEFCSVCEKKVYPLEKVDAGGKLFHKQCFRCLQCNCVLRMETYTLNSGKLYCIPHFKQLFIAKGNYEEGFGMDQHKRKWNRNNNEDDLLNSLITGTDH